METQLSALFPSKSIVSVNVINQNDSDSSTEGKPAEFVLRKKI
jgi:hypothetical protein